MHAKWPLVLAALLAAGPAAAETHDITMAGSVFKPESLTVRVGDKLRFVNNDTTNHQVFAPKVGYAFDLRNQPAGETREIVMIRAGTIDVECILHAPHMKMTLEVKP